MTPKTVPPTELQLPNESRRFWKDLTDAILSKQFNLSNTVKQEIEEKQRQKATERKTNGTEWKPRYFTGAVSRVFPRNQ